MKTEIEAKWTDVDHNRFREVIKNAGAKLITPMRQMVRQTFDDKDGTLSKIGGWVRLRDEGDKITLCYKQLNSRELDGTKEICLEVDDYKTTLDFLKAIGLKQKSIQETRRETWELDGAEIVLDEWPWVPTFIEIEADDEDHMKKIVNKLGLNMDDALYGSVEPVYQQHYNATEDEICSWSEITFSSLMPEWLRKIRKNK